MTTISNADEIDYDIKSHKAPSLNVIDRQPPKPFIPQETVVLKNCPIEVCLEDVDVCGFSGNHPLITLPQINWKHLLYNLDIKGILGAKFHSQSIVTEIGFLGLSIPLPENLDYQDGSILQSPSLMVSTSSKSAKLPTVHL